MTRATMQATPFLCLPFLNFPTFPFAGNSAYPNDCLFDGNYTIFSSLMIEFSRLFHLILVFSLQFFAIPYFVTCVFAVMTSDESS